MIHGDDPGIALLLTLIVVLVVFGVVAWIRRPRYLGEWKDGRGF